MIKHMLYHTVAHPRPLSIATHFQVPKRYFLDDSLHRCFFYTAIFLQVGIWGGIGVDCTYKITLDKGAGILAKHFTSVK